MDKRNQLDERQEQIVLKIEHNGCWFAFWALLVAQIVEQFIFGFDFKYIAGEWIIFMILAVYLCSACLKNGIWDRHLKANGKTNLIVSAVAAVAFGVVMAVGSAVRYPGHLTGSLAGGLISAVCVFVLIFVCLSILARSYRKRQQEMEQEPEDE